MFKIIGAVSDSHGELPEVPSHIDLLLHAGDICPDWRANSAFMQAKWLDYHVRQWLDEEVGKIPMITTWGNHDWVGMANIQPDLPWKVLVDKAVEVDGLKVYGTPWSKQFGNWAFMKEEGPLNSIFARIPEGLDVLVVHGPPFGHCDDSAGGERLGSQALLKHIRRAQPAIVVCGHIHEARGDDTIEHANGRITRVHNVSMLNLAYQRYAGAPVKTIIYDTEAKREVD